MFELFEHTADVGIRASAPTVGELFEEAAKGLFSILISDLEAVQPRQTIRVELAEEDRELLLRDWLSELLYRFDVDRLLFSRFEVSIRGDKLTANAHGEVLDEARHALECEVKAITYHGLTVRQTEGQWLAEVIVDI